MTPVRSSRRSFLLGAGAALLAAGCAPLARSPGTRRHELVLRGGTIFDGEGIRLVVVNGRIALRDGSRASISSGRALRPSA